jgi:hypothetical protein
MHPGVQGGNEGNVTPLRQIFEKLGNKNAIELKMVYPLEILPKKH